MKERFRLKTSFGEKIVEIKVMYYVYGNGLCLKFLQDGECYGYATVNFENRLPKYMAYVDTNDMPYIEEFIEKYKPGAMMYRPMEQVCTWKVVFVNIHFIILTRLFCKK